ncbi:MAG: aspartate aminotransferase family protein, partial [Planctomycetota bacterium]|nr:aspartate aminotransferase family protein [Planctomycetota bacterium]
PSMLNVDAPLAAGRLAQRLCERTHPRLCRASFGNSGAEVADMAIKTARLATGRRLLVSCHGAYHGLSVGTLPLLSEGSPLRPQETDPGDAVQIPFNDVKALEEVCARRQPAAFFVEPIQGEGGMRVPDDGYLRDVARLCRAHGCLLVVDEVQTGLGRTGKLFATPFPDVVPDILLVGKALSGGLVPVAAALMSVDVWETLIARPKRCRLNASTFAGGHLAMTAGLATLEVIETENLAGRAAKSGAALLAALRALQPRHPVLKEVRGRGLMVGIEFQRPSGLLYKAVPEWVRDELFEHVVAVRLLAEHGFVTQACGLAPGVLRAEPPLVITHEEITRFVAALDRVLTELPSYSAAVWSALRQRLTAGIL